jgi:ABC-type transport system involved in cytochrome c biogenesis ATPase subunit
LVLFCLLIIILSLIWNILTKQFKINNNENNNNCVLIGHKKGRKNNLFENVLLWKRKKTFSLPQYEKQQQLNKKDLTTIKNIKELRF